ncbi:hypothetical protein BU16DRAFT_527425 [Lophium mytilinum]|uniref:Uncharacterized protein n=1 Tax=Lophium mytilinum TaxID=390894 RepID=A0A6A6QU53_9PEZI|nr:hypothetical protein BU16DRAFT_527425 [Lophium mytilinum]
MLTVQTAIKKYHTSVYNYHMADLQDITDSHLAAINEAEAMAALQSNKPTPPLADQLTELSNSLTSLAKGIDSFFEGLPIVYAKDPRPYPDPNLHFKAHVRTMLAMLQPHLDVHRGVFRALEPYRKAGEQGHLVRSETSGRQVDELEKLVKEIKEVTRVVHRTFGYPGVPRSRGVILECLKGVQQSVKREQELVRVLLVEGNAT